LATDLRSAERVSAAPVGRSNFRPERWDGSGRTDFVAKGIDGAEPAR